MIGGVQLGERLCPFPQISPGAKAPGILFLLPTEKAPARRSLAQRRVLLVFQSLDLAFQHFADEGRPALPPDQLVDTLAKPFRQTNIGRFHIERRSSHARGVTKHGARSIGSRKSGTGY